MSVEPEGGWSYTCGSTPLLDQMMDELAATCQVPVEYLGADWAQHDYREVRRFVSRHNATFKGLRRRQRRLRAELSRLAHERSR